MVVTNRIHVIFWTLALVSHIAWGEPTLPGAPDDANFKAPRVGYTRASIPRIPTVIHEKWMEHFFDGPELWYFRSPQELLGLLKHSGLEEVEQAKLLQGLKTSLTVDEMVHAATWLPFPKEAKSFLLIPNKIRAQLPQAFLQSVTEHQYRITGRLPNGINGPSAEVLERAVTRNSSVSAAVRKEIERNTVFLEGRYRFLVTPQTWNLMSRDAKRTQIEAATVDKTQAGIDPFVEIAPFDDIDAIGRFYAGERDPRPLIRYLRRLREKSPHRTLEVPLENILHTFIRKRIDTYADCHGPNCFDAARNVGLGNANPAHLGDPVQLEREIKTRYRYALNGERYRPGDVLVYRNKAGGVVHAAVIASDGIVFTKNGMSKFSAYLFQPRQIMEQIYFPDGKFDVTVYKGVTPPRRATCGLEAVAPTSSAQ